METVIITKKMIKLPKRKKNSSKGDNGRVFILGGSHEYVGAPALAGIAAMRSGADSVVIAAPNKTAWAINCLSADIVTKKLPGEHLSLTHYSVLAPLLEKTDCLIAGIGIFERQQSIKLLRKVIDSFDGYKVLDAAALFAFNPSTLKNCILTPNHREFQRLSALYNLKKLVENGNVIIQKSRQSRIITKNGVFKNKTGNAGLTKAGTGDVLSGLAGGFLSQSKNLLESAINASYILGKTADLLLRRKKGYFYLASDLALEILRIKPAL